MTPVQRDGGIGGGSAGDQRAPGGPVVAWALFALVLALFAIFPWFDRLARDAGRPDLALAAALTGLAMVATGSWSPWATSAWPAGRA